MKQGTVSVLIGCHSVMHSIQCLRAWMKQNEGYPAPWQIACIFLHDIGHIGTNYLDNKSEKAAHWVLGAAIAQLLFGQKGLELIAGHCVYSGYPKNKLYYMDKLPDNLIPNLRWIIPLGLYDDGYLTGVEYVRG